jgi:hypothetical protein
VLITGVLLIFSIFHFYGFSMYISKKKKELKIQKQEKENCFANLKEREDSQWCYLPKLR